MKLLTVKNGPRELRAAVLAVRAADKDIRRVISQDMRSTMNPVWRSELATRATRSRDQLLTAGARIAGGNPPALITASSRRRIGSGGGLIPVEHWPGFEYGTDQARSSTYTRHRAGYKPHQVTRNVLAGHPPRYRNGRVIGPTARQILPRIASYWVQAVVKTFLDAAEKGR